MLTDTHYLFTSAAGQAGHSYPLLQAVIKYEMLFKPSRINKASGHGSQSAHYDL